MKLLALLALAPLFAHAAPHDSRIVLGPQDTVTVTLAQSRRYRCAVGVLVVVERGTKVVLSCAR